MAGEWWSSVRTGGDHASTSPATTQSASSRPTNLMSSLQSAGLPDSAAAAASFFLDDPHMDWAQSFMQGKVAEAEQPTSLTFNALLQLQGDASHQFLLDQAAAPPVLPYSVPDVATVVAVSQQGVSSFYADSQQQQQFPSFFSSSGLFGAPAQGSSPPIFLQAQKPARSFRPPLHGDGVWLGGETGASVGATWRRGSDREDLDRERGTSGQKMATCAERDK